MNGRADDSTMASGWNTYQRFVLSETASGEQWLEIHRAFYAGAAYLFAALVDNAGLPEPQAMLRLDVFQAELEKFADDLKEGRA